MLGGLLSKILLLLFGYAMPAFECFKTVEASPGDADMLRFWCQYWMPMYGEMKLAFFVYMWYPKTKGSDVVYDTFLRPMVMQYEPNIEQRLVHLRAKSGQLIAFYVKNFADKGPAFFMDILRYVVSDKTEALDSERSRRSSWNPFAARRRPPSPPPREPNFDAADLNAAAVADVIRASVGAKPRRQHSGEH